MPNGRTNTPDDAAELIERFIELSDQLDQHRPIYAADGSECWNGRDTTRVLVKSLGFRVCAEGQRVGLPIDSPGIAAIATYITGWNSLDGRRARTAAAVIRAGVELQREPFADQSRTDSLPDWFKGDAPEQPAIDAGAVVGSY